MFEKRKWIWVVVNPVALLYNFLADEYGSQTDMGQWLAMTQTTAVFTLVFYVVILGTVTFSGLADYWIVWILRWASIAFLMSAALLAITAVTVVLLISVFCTCMLFKKCKSILATPR